MEGLSIQGKTPLEKRKYYKLHLIWYRMRHGLFLMSISHLLRRVGIILLPYWIELEGLDGFTEPQPKDDESPYRISSLDSSEIEGLYKLLSWNLDDLKERQNSKYGGYGLYRKDELAAFTMVRFESFNFRGKEFILKSHEAYLENMYTFEAFRGKNLAPYLRYKCYQLLASEGKTRCYSITNTFNKSSLRFKQKLNAKHLELWLHLGLFNRFQ
jgi:GNAT superfamily N-acetyltransferase